MSQFVRKWSLVATFSLFAWLVAAPISAQEEGDAVAESSEEVDEITVVGSRRRDRSASDSPVPVDVVTGEEFLAQGDTDMDSLLANLIPSYNVGQEPISDAATLIRPANLRGLSPDATLILVNGKRRHRAAVIALLGPSTGSQAPDLSVIPAVALDRVEVLRDGASAQYGSDAIAGIINLVLREDTDGFTATAKFGRYYEGDGDAVTVAANKGFSMGNNGFANVSFEYKVSEPTSRSTQRADAQALINAGNTFVRTPAAQVWGAPEVLDDWKLFVNTGWDVSATSEMYAFGNIASRQVEGGFYFRNPHTRNGVFAGPTINGVSTVKVADFSGETAALIDSGLSLADAVAQGPCPIINIVNNVADPDARAQVAADPNCYSLIEKFPGGFTPTYGGYIDDSSFTAGIRGEHGTGWYYDASFTFGRSFADFYIYNTINPQLFTMRNEIPVFYDAGAYTETDNVFNVNLSRPFDVGDLASPLHVGLGIEARSETFEITAGEPNSYFIDQNLAAQGFGIGSNGFPGFQKGDEKEETVRAVAGFLDLEANLTDALLVGGAIRIESYADFGDTVDGKVTGRYQFADNMAVRGSMSSGFRVPTAGQANLRNVTTAFIAGRLSDIATLPPTNPIAVQLGAKPLTPEESVNLTLGFVFNLDTVDITVDLYQIEITDRLEFTSEFTVTPADIEALLAAGVSDASSFTSVRFFSNQQDIKASGLDLVATTHSFELAGGENTLSFVANWNDIKLTRFNPEFSDAKRVQQLENGRPESRWTITWKHNQENWTLLTRLRRYGEYYDAPADEPAWEYYPDPESLIDVELTFDINEYATAIVGIQNLLDAYPKKNDAAAAGVGLAYPESSPFSFNGGLIYGRLVYRM